MNSERNGWHMAPTSDGVGSRWWDTQDTSRMTRGMAGGVGLTMLLASLVRLVYGDGCDSATGIAVGWLLRHSRCVRSLCRAMHSYRV
jgi:ABC-type nitrate/sulfonate/bicarbonate transport system permease component